MKLIDVIVESPNIIGAYTPITLTNSIQNNQLYNKLLNNAHRKLYKIIDEYSKIYTLGQKIFCLNHLPKYGSILTDSKQSWDGKRFWERQINRALHTSGVYVYYVDFGTREVYEINDEIDWEIFEDRGISVWDIGTKYEMRRILISNKRLPELPPKQKRVKS